MSEHFFEKLEEFEEFGGSDSVRSGAALKHARTITLEAPLALELGGELEGVTVAYETYGELNAAGDNAVLISHAISGDSHVASHDEEDDPGWWEIVVGPGKAIDTNKYYVICPNLLGGCRGTTGPNSINPATERPYGQDFPTITVADMAEVQRRLVDELGIEKLLAVVGGSMGGHLVLQWGTRYGDRVGGAIAIGTSARLTSQALAFDVVGRNAIRRDPNFRGGQYYDGEAGPDAGLAMARMLGHITYLSREAMADKFGENRLDPRDITTEFEKKFSVGSYLAYKGEKFVSLFDANSYLTLSMSMDLFNLGGSAEALTEAFARTECRWMVMSFTSDWLFPPDQSRALVDALIATDKPVSYCNVASNCGHDAFLLDQDLRRYGELIRAFLANLDARKEKDGAQRGKAVSVGEGGDNAGPRLDYELIVELSRPAHTILDLGCGDGELLTLLKERGHERVVGVELDEEAIIACVRRGLDVIQADLNDGLDSFGDGQFDFVVLSQTLQAIKDVDRVVGDILRVGHRCIVTFPNFGYYKLREMLCEGGRAPESAGVLHYSWYDTPNIRFLTIADFEDYCAERQIRVHRRLTLDTEAGTEVYDDPNLRADLAIFVISR
jgi:homoserine O-acetyltransferase